MNFREASAEDIPALVDLGTEFFVESNFFGELTIDKVEGAATFGYMIEAKDHVVLVAEDDAEIVGFIIFDVVRYYTVEYVSHLFLLYAKAEYRRKGLGRDLLKEAEKIAYARGSRRFYCSSTAGFSDSGQTDKKLLNLYRRFGYKELGCFVMKELENV